MHHVPSAAKRVREHSNWGFQEYSQEHFHHFSTPARWQRDTMLTFRQTRGVKREAGQGVRAGPGLPVAAPSTRAISPSDRVAPRLPWRPPNSPPLSCGCTGPVISHREEPRARTVAQRPSSANQLPTFQNGRCLSAIA